MTIYEYTDPVLYMNDFLESRKSQEAGFSLRKWAKEMSLKSHTQLVMILNRKRELRIKHLTFLGDGLKLSSSEKIYFQTLIQFNNARDEKEKRLYEHFLADLHPRGHFSIKEFQEFKVISDWYHMAILAMTDLTDFKMTPQNISKKLKGAVSQEEIKKALLRLIDLDLLEHLEEHKYKATYNRTTTKDDVLNKGSQEYHKQVSELAVQSLISQDPVRREFQSFSMAISKDKIPLAKEMIREFRRKLSKAVSGNGDEIYQTNIQFFQLTKGPNSLGDAGVEEDKPYIQ